MEWLVLAIGVVALAIGAAMLGSTMNTRVNTDKDEDGCPADQETGQPWRRKSSNFALSNVLWARQTPFARFSSGLEDWRWEPAGLHRPALPGTATPDTTVLLKGLQVTVPVKLPHPWIVGPALPLSLTRQWLSSLSAAVSQTGDLLLWPWQAGVEGLPDRFAILIPAHKLAKLRSNPQDQRVALSSLVILDLRLGLPRKQIKAKQVSKRHTNATVTSSSLSQAAIEPDEPGLQHLTQTLYDLRQWSGGVPVLAGIPAGSSLAQDLGVLAGVGFDGAVIFASPLASGLPLPLSGSEVGMPLDWALTAARAAKGSAGPTDWPIIAAGSFATPADCLKAMALGATAVILDAVLAWPELLASQVENPETEESTQVDEALVSAAAELLTEFGREFESMLRILGCRRLGELSPRLLTDTSERPGKDRWPDSIPAATAATATTTPTAFTPPAPAPAPADVTSVSATSRAPGAAAGGWTNKREFVQPRLLAPRPLRRIRVLSQR